MMFQNWWRDVQLIILLALATALALIATGCVSPEEKQTIEIHPRPKYVTYELWIGEEKKQEVRVRYDYPEDDNPWKPVPAGTTK